MNIKNDFGGYIAMKRFLILFLISILVFSSCELSGNALDDGGEDEYLSEADNDHDDIAEMSGVISTSVQNSASEFLRDFGFNVSDVDVSEDRTSMVYYVWADNFANETSLTLEDAEKAIRDFCSDNQLSENAITVAKSAYNFTQLNINIEGITDEELAEKERNGDPAVRAAAFIGQNDADFDLRYEDEKLFITLKDGKSYSDLSESVRFVINEYLEYIVIE